MKANTALHRKTILAIEATRPLFSELLALGGDVQLGGLTCISLTTLRGRRRFFAEPWSAGGTFSLGQALDKAD
jgi:hypothetical protein